MRENKFRIYDTLNKEYEDPSNVMIDCETGEIYESIGVPMKSHLSAGIVSIHNQKRYIIEQYTGGYDRTKSENKEICVNDIVKNTYNNELYVVKWTLYGYYTLIPLDTYKGISIHLHRFPTIDEVEEYIADVKPDWTNLYDYYNTLKIIGNIHDE